MNRVEFGVNVIKKRGWTMKKILRVREQSLVVLLVVCCTAISAHVTAVCRQPDCCQRLLPLSCYGQAVEICMRVLADPIHHYDQETATDLCVGRLFRLSQAVLQMEGTQLAKKPYPSEDIAYIIGLMGLVIKMRQQDLTVSNGALTMVASIEARLAKLLHYP